uniref:Zinc finger CCCH-type, RNA binding motif and serine/arginine rich 2 n=1 Tax=Cynoglossus semilaevis TaxID=244447 RepID=A0A3P8VP44_CYNSE
MATCTPPSLPVLSQKQRRAAQRKERRKRKRQALAQARDCGICTPEKEINEDVDDVDLSEQERLRLHEEWVERERLAQEEFRLRCEREEAIRKRKEEEERLIKEEWEAQQTRDQAAKEQKLQEKRDKEEAVQKMLDEAENQLENGQRWVNPEPPETDKSENYGTERDVANCPFFLKTGACRFGDRCSRKHVYPTSSPTLMVRGMFTTFGMEETCRDDYDVDACLEHSEEDLLESFLDFYHDVLPEFRSVGKVIQFKVSCNFEPHLRGNVYVQFDTEEECKDAFIKFNGRWYAGRQLHCELCPVNRWKNAICGLFDRRKCPKGKHCNFLHVFRNPGNEFWEADRDLHLSPDRNGWGSRRDGSQSERHGDYSWRQRHGSRSPTRSDRSHSRREDSWSRERRMSHQDKEDKWWSRHSDRRNARYLHRRDRTRSRSRDREEDRRRTRSREKDRERKSRNRSEDRDKDGDTRVESQERSRSRSTEREKEDLLESFLDFYHDVLPEFRSVGKVIQFKVSCNFEPHLRGNVYVQFDTEEECKDAFIKFNGRWYAGRQLHCELCPVNRWKNAICGLFDRRKCPKGKHCNFLHVFRNPGNEFWEADRDLHLSPDRNGWGSRRDGSQSERHGDYSWRQRHGSRSPTRSDRSHSRREDSWSRERRMSHQDKEDKWWSRHSDRRNARYLHRRDRTRSRSRDREEDRRRTRSREKDRERKSRNRSEDRDKDGDTRVESQERSRSRWTESVREIRRREKSPKKSDKGNLRSRHKHSKKSKKKSKKKRKKKSHRSDESASSGDSEEEKDTEDVDDNNPAASHSEQVDENTDVDVNSDSKNQIPM